MDEDSNTQAVKKAKAQHLLRQLQLRLQYAKLKVDRGWQKQQINEVENLYFRQQKDVAVVSPPPGSDTSLPDPVDSWLNLDS
ncbi:hypothetical protein FB45DRAFT_1050593 [Roridomyces roridus]|uniref:Uncharacterized protein n=1 Tax=Roridomyces roridus TaxID=1738132 RepID=A0AAD7CK88_9AGAR|nr:hypothetical protein FB45DRAFT_1050593 [Roridomyces roridus]